VRLSDAVLLGIDTGGTFTDAVLLDAGDDRIIATAKAPTTHDDLADGISESVGSVLADSGVSPAQIGLVSISTTLATNALVEGIWGRVCLILAAFDDAMLARGGLAAAVQGDPVARVAGGHSSHGEQLAPLDADAVREAVVRYAPVVDAFAVCSQFAVRNPEHEQSIRDIVTGLCERPTTCSHELSALLNGPKRALTCLLNARLVGLIDQLCGAALDMLDRHGIDASLMLVRGDGSIVSAEFARARPIETILSGPAASIVGAAHLGAATDALVVDIGGTTTDIAVLDDGRPLVDPRGARVGGHRTMVEAVAIHTHGLGGDSEAEIDDRSPAARIVLGPRRVVPVCQLASEHPDLVHAVLDSQLADKSLPPRAGRFLITTRRARSLADTLTTREREFLESIGLGTVALATAVTSAGQDRVIRGLLTRGMLRASGFTPTDAAHVLGVHSQYDTAAARKAATLMARRLDLSGEPVCASGQDLAQRVVDRLCRRSAEVVLDAAFAADGFRTRDPSRSELVAEALDRRPEDRSEVTRLDIGVAIPIIALGAPAATYYPEIARLLDAEAAIPVHAGVANAIGAVVGHVRLSDQTTIAQPSEGQFRVHDRHETRDFDDLDEAVEWARASLVTRIGAGADVAGTIDPELAVTWDPVTATIAGAELFVEGTLTVVATGRPRIIPRPDRTPPEFVVHRSGPDGSPSARHP
jgi:N-methylhydantoinase A/oxoprolinase/acetone carboxylase beta subunit